jgi:hypothetical protein
MTTTKKSTPPKAGHNSKRTLDVIAGNIHALERRSAFDIGKLLIEAKETCEYGDWSHWLEEEFDWSPDTADNYMAAARLEARFRTVRNLKAPMRVIYDLADDLDDPDLPTIIEALVKANKSASKRLSVAAAENVIELARLRARHGDYPEATLHALDTLDLVPEAAWAKAATEKLKELRPTTEEEADRLIAEFKPSEPERQPESEPNDDDDDDDEGSEPAEQLVEEPATPQGTNGTTGKLKLTRKQRDEVGRAEAERVAARLIEVDPATARAVHDFLWNNDRYVYNLVTALKRALDPDEESADDDEESSAAGNDVDAPASGEAMKARMAALPDASDPGPIPDCSRRTKSCVA